MKKRLIIASLGLACVAVCFAAFQSCRTERFDSGSDAVIQQLDLPDEYNQVGIKHNEALEYVFQDMRASAVTRTRSGDTTKLTKEEYREFAAASLLNFARQDDFMSANMEICEQAVDVKNGVLTRSSGTSAFKPEIQVLLNEIKNVLRSREIAKKNTTRLKKALDKINAKAKNTLSELDAVIVYASTSTCYNSYIYWHDNHKKWFMMLNHPEALEYYSDEEINAAKFYDPTTRSGGSPNWWDKFWDKADEFTSSIADTVENWWGEEGRALVDADVDGAKHGAIMGAIVGSFADGVGAIPGAIQGATNGACYSSLVQAGENLYNAIKNL